MFQLFNYSSTHPLVTAPNHETHGPVTVIRQRIETNDGGVDAVRHAIGHVSVAVSVSRKHHGAASRVSNEVPVVGIMIIHHQVRRHPFVSIATSLCSDGGHYLLTVKICLYPWS